MEINKSFEFIKDIKCVGIALKPKSPQIIDTYYEVKNLFNKHGIKTLLEINSANMINENGLKIEEICEQSDLLISLGGDGTLLGLIRETFKYDIPYLGINIGNLGFLTDISMGELEDFIQDLNNKYYKINQIMMMEGRIENKIFYAFNEISISKKSISSMLQISAKINNSPFNNFYGDGVLVSTPTGSTAYNLSVGGPIVYPLTDAFIITPIAAHSLTQRPLVMPAYFEIEMEVIGEEGAFAVADGQEVFEVYKGECVKIKIAHKKVNMLHRIQKNYFKTLSEKLRWGN